MVASSSVRGEASPAPAHDADLTPTARELSDQGLRQYQQADYDAAIESFMSAFALSNNAGLLFNVAQAYRLKGDCARAKETYQRYLDAAPETALRSSVAKRLTEMDGCLKGGRSISLDGPVVTAATAEPVVTAPAQETVRLESPGISRDNPPAAAPRRRALVWTLRGSAAALLASSAVFGGMAWSAYRDYHGTSQQIAASEANDRFRTDARSAWIFAASGLACAVASYLVGRNP